MNTKLQHLNDALAEWVSDELGRMRTFWVFMVIALLPLVYPPSMVYCQYASSAVLQLVLLAILQSGTRIEAERTRRASSKEHEELKAIHRDVLKLLKELGVNGK